MSRTAPLGGEVARAMSTLGGAAEQGLGDPVLGRADGRLSSARDHGVSERRSDLLAAREQAEPAHLIALVVAITDWNRVMVARRIPPGGTAW